MSKPVSQTTPLRNEALRNALERALISKDRYVFALLARHGNLPGPRPNTELAAAVGDELARHGLRADPLVRELLSLDAMRALANSAEAFLPFVAAHALASRILIRYDTEGSWRALYDLAEDPRHIVRTGVVTALERIARASETGTHELVVRLSTWTDAFLQAAVALETFTIRYVLDQIKDPTSLLTFLEEALYLAEHASRSAERSQGRRRLLEVLTAAIPPIARRFADTLPWLIQKAATKHPDIRPVIEQALERLSKTGYASHDLAQVRTALDASKTPPRDPTAYRGPTRSRGRKASR